MTPLETCFYVVLKDIEMSQHTLGPWMIVQDDDDFNHYTVVTEQVGIADICYGGPKARDNAQLVAAAPDMYEALNSLHDAIWAELGAKIPPRIASALRVSVNALSKTLLRPI